MQRIFEMIADGNGYCTQNQCYPNLQAQQQQQQQQDTNTIFQTDNLIFFVVLMFWLVFSIYYFMFVRPNIRTRKVQNSPDRDNEGIM